MAFPIDFAGRPYNTQHYRVSVWFWLSMKSHIQQTMPRCFSALRQLCSISCQVPTAVFQLLVVTLVLSWLDYCNSWAGLPVNLTQRLHSAQNAAAGLIFKIRRYNHITDALISLQWLPLPERISFKITILTYRSLNGSVPGYLLSYFTHVVDVPSRHRLRSVFSNHLTVPFCRRTTFGKRSFPVAGANIWNELSLDITSAPSLRLQTVFEDFPVPALIPGPTDLTFFSHFPNLVT